MNICHKAVETWDRLLHRTVAAFLAAAMMLSFLPATAWAADIVAAPIDPVQVTDAAEYPKVEIKLNIVRSEYGTLNNTAELSLCVGPSDDKKPVTFRALATTLQFNTALFQPIDWEWVADLNPDATEEPIRVPLNGTTGNPVTSYYSVPVPAKKDDTLPATGAIAQCGIVTPAPADMSTNVTNGKQALLFFKAESYDLPITLTEMTTLAVIRFEVNPTLMKHLSIARNPDGSYTLSSDALTGTGPADKVVSDVAKLNAAAKNLAAGGTGLATDETPLDLPAADFTAVGFAIDKDISLSASPANGALHYNSADNRMYFVPGDVLADTAADAAGTMKVTIKGKEYTLKVPATENIESMVLAVDPALPEGDKDKYSYITNLIPPGNISFPVVSEMSYADKGVDLDRYSVLVFVDWDNTILGTLVVPKYENVASIVNEYIAKNFVHEKLRTPTEAQMASTARADTYRGKYPYSSPMKEGEGLNEVETETAADGSTIIVGEKFPLTNKLDYAFLRRPMERATNVDGTPTTDNTWVQNLDESNNTYYDTYFPYAYGWAKCTAENYVDTWTTLGSTGELSSYKVAVDGKASVTSTDANFQIADLVKGFGKDDSTVFLKAIYEPGDDLMAISFQYRLCTEPTYNKLNGNTAEFGGAYSVDVQYERASTELTNLRGVPRMRDPYVRQDTTPDLRWESNAKLGVDHNLPNATLDEASIDRSKTTYTRVQVINSEIMDVSLALSARQNKIDALLIDAYGSNFVSGGQRSDTNFNREDATVITGPNGNTGDYYSGKADFTVDNYNYYVSGESETRDPGGYYFDVVQFKDKNGSHGFVLYSTINNLLQVATWYSPNIPTTQSISQEDFEDYYAAYGNFADINIRLRVNNNDVEPTAANQRDFQERLIAAAEAAYAHRGDPDYWDNELDCARLSYHQLQWFFFDDSKLLDPVTAEDENHRFGFCHLHAACAALSSTKPKNWTQLMEYAGSSDPEIQDRIRQLTITEAEELSHLRQDSAGKKFDVIDDYSAALVAAVASLGLSNSALTWENVQYAILHPASDVLGNPAAVTPDPAETANYWWYDGTERVSLSSWSELLLAARHAITPVELPDGNTTLRYAKLNRLENAYNTAQDGTSVRAWVSATENLMTAYDKDKDEPSIAADMNFAAFRDKLVDALKAGCTTWGDAQYYLIHNSKPSHPANDAEIAGYWWHFGARKVVDIETMIQAARDYQVGSVSGDTSLTVSWENFSYDVLYDEDYQLHFRSTFSGTKYPDIDTFKKAVMDYIALPGYRTDDWNHFQYYLIYNSFQSNDYFLGLDAAYYWWRDGGKAETEALTLEQPQPQDRADALAAALSRGAFLAQYNGYPESEAFKGVDTALLTAGRLISAYDATKSFTDQAAVTADSTFFTKVKDLLVAKIGSTTFPPVTTNTLPGFTWEELQAAVLGTALPSEEDGGAWWKAEEKKPQKQNPPQDDFATLTGLVEAVAVAIRDSGDVASAETALKNFLTLDVAKNIGVKTRDGSGDVTQSELDAIQWATFQYGTGTRNGQCWGADGSEAFHFTWYQMQAIIIGRGRSISPDATAKTAVNRLGIVAPAWVVSGVSYSLRLDMPQGADVEVDPDTGFITTTTPDTITELPGGLFQLQRTITVLSPEGEILAVTTLIEIYDADYNLISSQTVTMPVPEPEEPVCTCGTETDEHAEDCPLYVAPEEPVCTCGTETDEHTEDCPLYVAPEEPICTCGSETGEHSSDCPLYVAPAETEAPTESSEPTESPEPTESAEPEPTPTPEPTVSPEPTETPSPEEPLPEPSAPVEETPEPTPTPEATPAPEPTLTPEPTPTPESTPTPEVTEPPQGTLETMPEIIDPEPPAVEPPKEANGVEGADGENVGIGVPAGPPETETTVIETSPPLGASGILQKRSAPRDYKKLTTRIVILNQRPQTASAKLLTRAGGMNMKQLKLNRIFSPPGQPLFGSVPLLLRSGVEERRRVV